jgi:hypothetical protein
MTGTLLVVPGTMLVLPWVWNEVAAGNELGPML